MSLSLVAHLGQQEVLTSLFDCYGRRDHQSCWTEQLALQSLGERAACEALGDTCSRPLRDSVGCSGQSPGAGPVREV